MTVSSTVRSAGPYIGTGSSTFYPFEFHVFDDTDIEVQVTLTDGTLLTYVIDSDFTVTLNSDQNDAPGGNVLLTVPLPLAASMIIASVVPMTQSVEITNAGGFLPKVIETALDRMVVLLQQSLLGIGGSIRVPEVLGVPVLPPAAQRAGFVLGFDSNGNAVPAGPVSGSVTAFALQLISSIGSTLVGFIQAGTGVATQTAQAKMRQSVTVLDFLGADPTGVADSTAAINSALTAAKHVHFPPGSYRITSQITIPAGSRVTFASGAGPVSTAPAAYLIKASSMAVAAVLLSAGALWDGGGIVGEGGNTGGGIQIIGNGAKIRDCFIKSVGGVAYRVGLDSNGGNFNSFELDHCTALSAGSHGFYIHDGTTVSGANANAGTLKQCFAQLCGADGFRFGHCFWVQAINCLTESCTGYGWYSDGSTDGSGVPKCRYLHVIGGDFNESNVAGICFDQGYRSLIVNADPSQIPATASSGLAGSAQRAVFGTFASLTNGLTVATSDGASPVTIDDGNAGDYTSPLILKKQTGNGNGRGVGIQASINDGTNTNVLNVLQVKQLTAGVYGTTLAAFKASASYDMLIADANINAVRPPVDNTISAGSASFSWTTIYIHSAAVVTSDRNSKQDIRSLDARETAVAVRLKGLMRVYRLRSDVEQGKAKLHCGAIAQDVQDAFKAAGLDPSEYAVVSVETDEQGQQRLGLRYDELLAFILAAV